MFKTIFFLYDYFGRMWQYDPVRPNFGWVSSHALIWWRYNTLTRGWRECVQKHYQSWVIEVVPCLKQVTFVRKLLMTYLREEISWNFWTLILNLFLPTKKRVRNKLMQFCYDIGVYHTSVFSPTVAQLRTEVYTTRASDSWVSFILCFPRNSHPIKLHLYLYSVISTLYEQ